MTTPQHTKPARLYRSRDDRVIAGVGGGLARYLGVDPVLVRLAIVALAIAGGGGILAYLIAWIIIPEEPPSTSEWDEPAPPASGQATGSGKARMVVGVALIVIGIGVLARWAIPALGTVFWPLVLVGIGAALLLNGARR